MNFEQFAKNGAFSLTDVPEGLCLAVSQLVDRSKPLKPNSAYLYYTDHLPELIPFRPFSEKMIRQILDAKDEWDEFLDRKNFALSEIKKLGKLTPELEKSIEETFDPETLEDLFHPYKHRPRSKAALAREAGISGLADWIWDCAHGTLTPEPGQTLEIWGYTFRNPGKGFESLEQVLQGARDLMIERLTDHFDLRQFCRTTLKNESIVRVKAGPKLKPDSRFKSFVNFEKPVSHFFSQEGAKDFLQIRRGWIEEELVFSIMGDEAREKIVEHFRAYSASSTEAGQGFPILEEAVTLALKTHIMPAMENDLMKLLKDRADQGAFLQLEEEFMLLLDHPSAGKTPVLAASPGHRGQVWIAAIGELGEVKAFKQVQIQEPESGEILRSMVSENGVKVCGVESHVGLSKEAHGWIRKSLGTESALPVTWVASSGSLAFANSDEPKREFPSLDQKTRSAIYLGRFLQDPVSALCDLDLRTLSLGHYQHDVSQAALKRILDATLASRIHQNGVSLTTASAGKLARVHGLDPALASNIIAFRETHPEAFSTPEDLLKVPGITQQIFETCRKFLKVEPPERSTGEESDAEESPFPKFRSDVYSISDLKIDEIYPGIVTHITTYGAFVDVGAYQDGLVHISQITHDFIKDPSQVLHPGQLVSVKVLEINAAKKQFSLSIKALASAPAASHAKTRRTRERFQQPKKRPTPSGNPAIAPVSAAAPAQRPTPSAKPKHVARPKEAFNNPFAALAGLKSNLKTEK